MGNTTMGNTTTEEARQGKIAPADATIARQCHDGASSHHLTPMLRLQPVAIASWANPQAGIVSRHHPPATADVEAEPMLTVRPIRATAVVRSPRHKARGCRRRGCRRRGCRRRGRSRIGHRGRWSHRNNAFTQRSARKEAGIIYATVMLNVWAALTSNVRSI
jgi:hypothetical protein